MTEQAHEVLETDMVAPHVLQLTLNRPEKLNAFNPELKKAFLASVEAAGRDPDVRVIVLRGAGRAFSVGVDVGGGPAQGAASGGYVNAARTAAADFEALRDGTLAVLLSVWRCPVPVIAQVHGYCMGIATILANCCDVVYCTEDAVVGWPAVPLGGGMISPTWAFEVGIHKAKEMSYTVGSRLSGTEAARLGWANHAVEPDQIEVRVRAAAGHMARLSKDLLGIKKAALNQVQARMGFEDAVRAGAAWDALAHDTDIVGETRKRITTEGIKPVIADWRPPVVTP